MKEYRPELPSGYREAFLKYFLYPKPDSIDDIWGRLDHWDELNKGFPRLQALGISPDIMALETAALEKFQQKILAAIANRDFVFLQKLIAAMQLTHRPLHRMNAYRAAVQAFGELFLDRRCISRKEWPTKKLLITTANRLLSQAGRAPISQRHVSRVLRATGLWQLPVTPGK
jgi:hypothetical protein